MFDQDPGHGEKVAEIALAEFNDFYRQFKEIPELSRQALGIRDHAKSLRLSSRRLQLYSLSIRDFSDRIRREFPELADNESHWDPVEHRYLSLVDALCTRQPTALRGAA